MTGCTGRLQANSATAARMQPAAITIRLCDWPGYPGAAVRVCYVVQAETAASGNGLSTLALDAQRMSSSMLQLQPRRTG